ncbi:M23 family metallopeptidase [Meiothermus rufus]|uniref:M23 family metallopeptidase n=1 Tax=Meiothermus rufus TaxID=604332 RepID=UPI00041D9CFF|nr:M23 family metallopeptidase [Meiothermus rufus]
MPREPHPLAAPVMVPLWVVALLPIAVVALVLLLWDKSAREKSQLAQLQHQAHRLALELEAEKSRNQAYNLEALQLQQSLQILEAEVNRLRAKAGLPKIRLVPEVLPSDPLPAPAENTPRGAGEPIALGNLLLSLRAQVEHLATELEATATAFEHPLPPDPRPGRLVQRPLPDPTRLIPTGLPLHSETRLTSPFGYRPNPFGLGYEFHNGIDLAAPEGTPVYATAAGTVSQMGWNPVFGLMVLIDHNNGLHTLYGHLSAAYVERGQPVEQGRLIGAVGSTGRSTGPHLHYTVYRYGLATDPWPYINTRAGQ